MQELSMVQKFPRTSGAILVLLIYVDRWQSNSEGQAMTSSKTPKFKYLYFSGRVSQAIHESWGSFWIYHFKGPDIYAKVKLTKFEDRPRTMRRKECFVWRLIDEASDPSTPRTCVLGAAHDKVRRCLTIKMNVEGNMESLSTRWTMRNSCVGITALSFFPLVDQYCAGSHVTFNTERTQGWLSNKPRGTL